MHIVFIVGSYYPKYSAVGKCVGNVADELSKYHNVTVICSKNYPNQKDREVFNGQSILRIMTKEKSVRFKRENKIQSSMGLSRKIYEFSYKLYKMSKILKLVFSKTSINKELVRNYSEAINDISEHIDVIIPASMPFESVVAAVNYKKNCNENVKVIPYLFDQFADNDNLHRFQFNKQLKRKRHINLERELLKKTESILSMHSLKMHFKNDLPGISNVHYVEHPLILKPNINGIKGHDGRITISYIGSLLKGYVTPDYLLDIYIKTNIEKTVLNFYIIGNCFDIVDEYSKKFSDSIINHGSVDKETANKRISGSDILISIAEKKGIQLSSKIFDYISYGKPIIHFYTVDDDVNLKILKKYPNALCLKQEEKLLNENVKAFMGFCNNNYDKSISFEKVTEIFEDATPKYTVNIIEKII